MSNERFTQSKSIMQEIPDVGARAKAIRKSRSLTLNQVSERSGVSIATLSKLENGQVAGSFNTIYKVARGLGVLVGTLMDTEAETTTATGGRRSVTKAGEADIHPIELDQNQYYEYFLHANDISAKKMFPVIMRIRTRELPPKTAWSNHAGEEFVFVLEGSIEFHCEAYSPVVLKAGESVYFDCAMYHAFVTVSEEDAVLLSVSLSVLP